MSDWDDKLPWRSEKQREDDIRADVESQALRENLIEQMVLMNVAIQLNMGEQTIEEWIDRVWDGLREGILEPGVPPTDRRRQKLDLILQLYLHTLTDEVSAKVGQFMHELECPVHGIGLDPKELFGRG